MSLIEVSNVTKIFRKSHLGRTRVSVGVKDLTLNIERGEVFGLLGLNGAGKTTTIKMLLGLIYPTQGTIRIDGRAMPDIEIFKNIGYLPEAAYMNKYLTGRETVRVFAILSKIPKSKVNEAVENILEKVGMTKAADRRLSEYSKGMLQRISMAQALIHDPEILIMDEPITGLDPLAIKEVRQLILWLKSQGKSVFFSSHNISEVEKVCDRIGILTQGKLTGLIEKEEWKNKEGELEKIFTTQTERSEAIGPLKFG